MVANTAKETRVCPIHNSKEKKLALGWFLKLVPSGSGLGRTELCALPCLDVMGTAGEIDSLKQGTGRRLQINLTYLDWKEKKMDKSIRRIRRRGEWEGGRGELSPPEGRAVCCWETGRKIRLAPTECWNSVQKLHWKVSMLWPNILLSLKY